MTNVSAHFKGLLDRANTLAQWITARQEKAIQRTRLKSCLYDKSSYTMNVKDSKLIALQFNEYINSQDIDGLARLMTEDHTFIDREGKANQPKESMVQGWGEFFQMFPRYKNTFTRVESRDNLVIILGLCVLVRGRALRPRHLDGNACQ